LHAKNLIFVSDIPNWYARLTTWPGRTLTAFELENVLIV